MKQTSIQKERKRRILVSMNKYDEILNELVYQIDDVVYDFYSQSNDIISHKKGAERLLEYRDQSLNTVNEMNVRSLEIISDIKKRDLVEARSEALIQKNRELVASILLVLESAPNRNEVLEDIEAMATKALDSAKRALKQVETSDTYEKIKEVSVNTLDLAKEKIDDVAHDERFIKGKEVVIKKSKEAVVMGTTALKEGNRKLSDWIADKKDTQDAKPHTRDEGEEESLNGDDSE